MSALDALADKAEAASEPREAPAPSGAQLGSPSPPKRAGGVNPFLVAGAALVAGVLFARWIDWRGHAHPR
jgi:hypothetical protein